MSNTDYIKLCNLFAPVIYLFCKEQYYPSSIDYILENSTLVDENKIVEQKPIKNETIFDLSINKYKGQTGLTNFYIDIPDSIIHGNKNLSNVPIYCMINEKDDYFEIIYIAIYPYNGSYNILGIQKVGQHYGDIEHLTLKVKKTYTGIPQDIISVMFGSHGTKDGRLVENKDLEFENGKLVAYSARNGHGFYNKPYMAYRFYGLANDYIEKGKKWIPSEVSMLYRQDNPNFNKTKMGWIYMAGRLGKNGVTSLSDKYWFYTGESNETLNPPRIYSKNITLIYFFVLYLIIFSVVYGIVRFGLWQQKIRSQYFFGILIILILILIMVAKKLIIKFSNE